MTRCIRVPKSEGNTIRIKLNEIGLLNLNVKICVDRDMLLIPILSESYMDYEVCDKELEVLARRETDYRNLLPKEIRNLLPNSFDNIGDIMILKLTDELLSMKYDIGNALLKVNSSTRAVFLDHGVRGELRIRDLELIAGTGTSETRHRESGVIIVTDPAKVYYTPRLATERGRIASMVKDGEIIIDMFAGVAPFSLTICKHANPKKIYAIDLNHDAVEYMKKNIKLNHITDIVPMEGDAKDIIKNLPMADRIIMNLPQMSQDFLFDALLKTKTGGIVHMYKIIDRHESQLTADNIITNACAEDLNCKLLEMKELKTYSPSASMYVLDIVKK
ncbi:MAG: class I SAM-dependent methyltransferase family protein [archaeon]|nr:class I SAM-dependent methyltransferase family protein [archaeon]